MSHAMEMPLVHHYRGQDVFVKFGWHKPNDETPYVAQLISHSEIQGLGVVAAQLRGPWVDYQQAKAQAYAAAEMWIDSRRAE